MSDDLNQLLEDDELDKKELYRKYLERFTDVTLLYFNKELGNKKLSSIMMGIVELIEIIKNDELKRIYKYHLESLLKIYLINMANGQTTINFNDNVYIKSSIFNSFPNNLQKIIDAIGLSVRIIIRGRRRIIIKENDERYIITKDDNIVGTRQQFLDISKEDNDKLKNRAFETKTETSLERNLLILYSDLIIENDKNISVFQKIRNSLIMINSIHYLFDICLFPAENNNLKSKVIWNLLNHFKIEYSLPKSNKTLINKERFKNIIQIMPTLYYYQSDDERQPFINRHNFINELSSKENFNTNQKDRLELLFIQKLIESDLLNDDRLEGKTGFSTFDDIYSTIIKYLDSEVKEKFIPSYMNVIIEEFSNDEIFSILKNIDK